MSIRVSSHFTQRYTDSMNTFLSSNEQPLRCSGGACIATMLAILISSYTNAQTTASPCEPGPCLKLNDENGTVAEITLESSEPARIIPSTGNIEVSCKSPGCDLLVGEPIPVTITDVSLTVTPTSVSQGQFATFEWNSRGAWDCQGFLRDQASGALDTSTSWDDPESRLPSGTDNVSTSTLIPGDFLGEIVCRNGPESVSASAAFTVTDPNPDTPQFCIDQGRVPPAGMVQDTNIIHNQPATNTVNWAETWGQAFPDGNQRKVVVEPDMYVALAFNTGSVTPGTTVRPQFSDPQFSASVAGGDKIVSISECPGDFGPQADPGCRLTLGGGAFTFKIGGDDAFCNLQNDTTYFFNVLYTNETVSQLPDSSPTEWFCTGAPSGSEDSTLCGNVVSP